MQESVFLLKGITPSVVKVSKSDKALEPIMKLFQQQQKKAVIPCTEALSYVLTTAT